VLPRFPSWISEGHSEVVLREGRGPTSKARERGKGEKLLPGAEGGWMPLPLASFTFKGHVDSWTE